MRNNNKINKWIELSRYVERVLLHGCTDRIKLERICWNYAKNLFKPELDRLINEQEIEKYKKLKYEIMCHIRVCIIDMIEWARKAGEPFQKLNTDDLSLVRERFINHIKEGKSGVYLTKN